MEQNKHTLSNNTITNSSKKSRGKFSIPLFLLLSLASCKIEIKSGDSASAQTKYHNTVANKWEEVDDKKSDLDEALEDLQEAQANVTKAQSEYNAALLNAQQAEQGK